MVHDAAGGRMMSTRSTFAVLARLLAATLLAAGCRDAVSPELRHLIAAQFAAAASGIVLDQQNGTLNQSGTEIIKGFNPTNPHLGDAIIATFYWVGSTNIIDSVTDVLSTAPFTPVGNRYTLIEYVTAGGISMATYVATNVQNFPDPNPTDVVLAVRANLAVPVVDGGIKITAWTGVDALFASALGAHRSASAIALTPTTIGPGAITLGPGALAYAVTMANGGVPPQSTPAGFSPLLSGTDAVIQEDGRYLVSASGGSVDPQWVWPFQRPSAALATMLALNPPPPPATHLVFTVQPSNTTAGNTISPAVQVAAQDDAGNTATRFRGTISIALGTNPSGGTLSGTTTATTVNGVATFSDLRVVQAGNGYTLVATADGLTTATSASFNVTAPPPPQARVHANGGGRIDPAIGKTTFAFDVDSRTGPPFRGQMKVVYHSGRHRMTRIRSLTIDGVTSSPDPRGGVCVTWTGIALVNNTDRRRYTATACDNGQPGCSPGKGPDRFGITVDGAISTGLTDLTGGNIRVRQ
jgi:hypothetical protein